MGYTTDFTGSFTCREIRRLRSIYAKVPPITGCKGLCYDSCTNVPVPPVEAHFLIEKYHAPLYAAKHLGGHVMPTLGVNVPCPFLKDNRCSIYEDRPLICRLFGHPALTLRCVHGCTSARPLNDQQTKALMVELLEASNDYHRNYLENPIDAMDRQVGDMLVGVEIEGETNADTDT